MGSFDVGCAISNLSIAPGDDIGFIIMGKPPVYNTPYPPQRDRSFYTYTTDLYKPFLPPVYGEYGDYGRINEIVPSVTTALIEDLFRRPVEVVMSIISYDDGVYDSTGSIVENYFIGDKSVFDDVEIDKALIMLGFTHSPSTIGKPEEFTFGNFIICSYGDSRYTIVDRLLNKVLKPSFYCDDDDIDNLLEFFGQVTGDYPGYDRDDYGIIKTLAGLTGTFFLKQVYNDMSGYVNNDRFDKEWSDFMTVLGECDPSMPEFYTKTMYLPACTFLQRETIFPNRVIPLLATYKENKEFSDVPRLLSIMRSVNRMLIPSFCGSQHGNDKLSLALNVSTDAILKQRIQKYEEW